MDLLELIDFKVLFLLVTVRLWWPVVKVLWRAVNPYPALFAPPHLRADAPEGPQLDDALESEEWAIWKLRRQREEEGEELPRVEAMRAVPRLKRMSSSEDREHVGLRRSA